jgi:rhodanese-related sulfurtransferase
VSIGVRHGVPGDTIDRVQRRRSAAGQVAAGALARRYAQTNVSTGSDYTPHQVAELLSRGEIQLIDVRQPYEHEAGRIAGGRLIALTELQTQVETIDRDGPVVFYCRSGSRSAMAAEAFRQAGFDAHNMAGGLLEWEASGLPLEPADGHVAA